MTTPNLLLTYPTVLTTPGPTYASLLNGCFDTIDAHDHSTGKGVKVTPSGMNFNQDVDFGDNNLINLRTARLNSLLATPTNANDLHVLYAKGNELCYRDGAGTEVAITSGGSIAGATGTISNLGTAGSAGSYSSVSKSLLFTFAASSPMRLNIADILLYPYDGATAFANFVTLKSPTALASNYSITLPTAVPSQASVLSMSTAGALTTGLVDGSQGAPALAFASALGLGLYKQGSGLGISVAGSLSQFVGTASTQFPDGNLTTPAMAFINESNTGIYRAALNAVAFSIAGSQVMVVESNGLNMAGSNRIYSNPGTTANPGYSFIGLTDHGLFAASNQLSLCTNGTERLRLTGASSLQLLSGILTVPDGISTNPSYKFSSEATGLYLDAASTLGFTCAGTRVATLSSSVFSATGGLQTASGGTFKVKLFTGSVSASGLVSLDVGSGQIYGAFGSQAVGGFNKPIGTVSSASALYFTASGANAHTIQIENDSGGSITYYATVFYQ